MLRLTPFIAAFVLIAALAGCKQYEYVLLEPAESAQTFSLRQSDLSLSPVLYQIAETDQQLRVRVVNVEMDEDLRLIGEKSYIVDPEGESYSLSSRTIPPRGFWSLYMPPRRPRGSGIGFGVGVGGGSDGTFGGVGVGGYDDDEWSYGDDPPYYSWHEGDLKLRLVFMHDDEELTHDFLFTRRIKQ